PEVSQPRAAVARGRGALELVARTRGGIAPRRCALAPVGARCVAAVSLPGLEALLAAPAQGGAARAVALERGEQAILEAEHGVGPGRCMKPAHELAGRFALPAGAGAGALERAE